ncbi:MAG: ABC transporter substrate-binding protein [Hydrogenophaga sp.]|uniref:ABC transporter substrate-binding protein n=1 Tax=Hydrogenophaga sp. TaxID=1904254 RepID=UPI0027277E21|nr:ABC transporter substrate-binding protein [Hydrogenophaga sp.]MDO9482932.1 ABC transporter substrate-binding protein [Hydrogenophaga sp.]MDP1895206.1 ABC transporter substrate-binding protein [Hydrogenophaga sp.]MDP2092801.1 ABC transporter substrate-binding protein [Hydrogenophaga sp.]MDP3343193.1 ABC transporter substrate-binding protein [Hydrogenophaga sp.]MDP3808211.1 ABC transporter substrate-binding protein [Hydrogenophaga sp.]
MKTWRHSLRAATLALACLGGVQAMAAAITVGQVAPLSGREAVQGRAYAAGLKLALDQANKAGVGGHRFTLVSENDGGRPEETTALTTRLVTEHKPLVLAGFFGSRNIGDLVASGLLEREKLALVGYRITELDTPSPWLYNVRANLRDEVQKMAQHLATIGITRLGVLHEDGPGAEALATTVEGIARAAGQQVQLRATYAAGTTRVTSAVDTFLAKPPQAILILASGAATAAFIEEYRISGGAAQLFAQSGADVEQLARRLGEDTLRGVAIAQVTPSPYRLVGRLAKELSDAVGANKELEPMVSYAMMEGYIAGKVIAEAARRMGAQASREAFVTALDSIDAYDLGGYRIGYRNGQHQGSRFVDMTILSATGRVRH